MQPDAAHAKRVGGLRRRLGHLTGLEQDTAATERAILAQADARLGTIGAELRTLAPRAHTDATAGARYEALILERGKLQRVAASSRAILAGESPENG